jgi:D-3-phosphoglycerate dehydrogenase
MSRAEETRSPHRPSTAQNGEVRTIARGGTVAFATRQAIDIAEDQEAIEGLGAKCVVVESATADGLAAGLAEVDLVVNRWGRMDETLFGKLDRCRAVIHPSTGYELVDVEAATKHGIVVFNLLGLCRDEVASHTFALLLALNRKLPEGHARARAGTWNPLGPLGLLPIGGLTDETLGLLSFGDIAREVARRAQAFHLKVVAFDPYVDPRVAKDLSVEFASLDDVLRRSDYVSCHVPLNPRTHHMLSEKQFRSMKPSAIFINTARGPVVDERALIRALTEGWIAAAGLDVLEQEPPDPTNPLLHMDNVIVTPHMAGNSDATTLRRRPLLIKSVADYFRGDRPAGLVNGQVWEEAQRRLHAAIAD